MNKFSGTKNTNTNWKKQYQDVPRTSWNRRTKTYQKQVVKNVQRRTKTKVGKNVKTQNPCC